MGIMRVALGVALLLFPGWILRLWFGRDASSPYSRLMARSAGGRDVALGLGTLFALERGAPVRGWLEATMLSDATDGLAILVASRHVPRGRALTALLPALAAVGYGRTIVSRLPPAGPTEEAPIP